MVKLYLPLKRSQVLYLPQNEGYLLIEWQRGRVNLYGILRTPQRRVIPGLIRLVPLFDAPGRIVDFGRCRLSPEILDQPATGALFEPCDQKNFYVRVGKNHGAHISSVGHEVPLGAYAALQAEQPIAHSR